MTSNANTRAENFETSRTRAAIVLPVALLILCGAATGAAADPGKPSSATAAADAARGDIARTLGFVPQFFSKLPALALPGAWEEMKTLQLNPHTALGGRTKELIGLAVAAQVPCRYCIVAHTEFAKLNGATDAEIAEAIAMASLTRNLSTMLNGLMADEGQFRRDIDKLVKGAKAAAKKRMSASAR